MLQDLLLVLNMLICIALIAVVLMQQSEGGAFGTSGPTGLVTARGAGDLLTRTTWVLFTLFLVISLALTLLGGREHSSQTILQRLKSTSINPDQAAASQPAATNRAPAQSGGLQLPSVAGAPAARRQPVHRPAPTSAPSVPGSLALPPISGGTNTLAP